MEEDILLQLLPTGEIRFRRGNKEQNEIMVQILSQLVPTKIEEIKEFLKGSEEIILLKGDTIFCG